MLSKDFKTYLGSDTVYNSIDSMIEERKYCIDMMKRHFNKELAMIKEENEDFQNYTKCGICNIYFTIVKVSRFR